MTIAFLAAIAVLVIVLATGPISVDGLFYADRLSAVLLLLITGVGTVVTIFGARYLAADDKQPRFLLGTVALVTTTSAMVCAATLVGLAAAWVLASASLIGLLGLYGELDSARQGVRKTALTFAIADVALVSATTIAVATWGNLRISELAARAPEIAADGTAVTAFALLLVLAAVGRSAQLPLQGWLPATLAAPTPVSALLHAGVVNAGGVLLVRLSPIFGASRAATYTAFAVGAATAIYGTALMLTKSDVKGALAHSTMGQMGFMVMTCGFGAYAAAVFHLVAHGMYKATLFLGSGSAVSSIKREHRAPRPAPLTGGQRTAVIAASVAIPTIAVGLALSLMYGEFSSKPGGVELTAFAWVTGSWATASWARRNLKPVPMLTWSGALIAVTFGYLAALTGFAALLDPVVGAAEAEGVSPWLLVAPAAVLLASSLVLQGRSRRLPRPIADRLYVAALAAGNVSGRAAALGPSPALTHPRIGQMTLQTEGGRS